jgi:hypothetical protein
VHASDALCMQCVCLVGPEHACEECDLWRAQAPGRNPGHQLPRAQSRSKTTTPLSAHSLHQRGGECSIALASLRIRWQQHPRMSDRAQAPGRNPGHQLPRAQSRSKTTTPLSAHSLHQRGGECSIALASLGIRWQQHPRMSDRAQAPGAIPHNYEGGAIPSKTTNVYAS